MLRQLACALGCRAQPTSGLDSAIAAEVMASVKGLQASTGCTLLITIHQPSPGVFDMFDELLILKQGRMCAGPIQTPVQLLPFTKAASAPLPLALRFAARHAERGMRAGPEFFTQPPVQLLTSSCAYAQQLRVCAFACIPRARTVCRRRFYTRHPSHLSWCVDTIPAQTIPEALLRRVARGVVARIYRSAYFGAGRLAPCDYFGAQGFERADGCNVPEFLLDLIGSGGAAAGAKGGDGRAGQAALGGGASRIDPSAARPNIPCEAGAGAGAGAGVADFAVMYMESPLAAVHAARAAEESAKAAARRAVKPSRAAAAGAAAAQRGESASPAALAALLCGRLQGRTLRAEIAEGSFLGVELQLVEDQTPAATNASGAIGAGLIGTSTQSEACMRAAQPALAADPAKPSMPGC